MSKPLLGIPPQELEAFLERIRERASPADYELMRSVVDCLETFAGLLAKPKITFGRLKASFLGSSRASLGSWPRKALGRRGQDCSAKQGDEQALTERQGSAPTANTPERHST